MKQISLFAGIIAVLFSCNSNKSSKTEDNKKQSDSDTIAKVMIPQTSCYSFVQKNDTILLKIENFPNVVTGILKYKFSEKDNNEGTIEGKLEGDKIFADYTFQSEGKTSIREVAFLIKDKNVVEGYGEMEEKDGKMVFKNRSKINFKEGTIFSTIDCVENDSKFHQ